MDILWEEETAMLFATKYEIIGKLIVADIGIQNSIRNTTNLFWRD
jgi:hypothetical protein